VLEFSLWMFVTQALMLSMVHACEGENNTPTLIESRSPLEILCSTHSDKWR